MDLGSPKIDPRILEISRQIAERKRKEDRRDWWKKNALSIIAIILAVLELLKGCFVADPKIDAVHNDVKDHAADHEAVNDQDSSIDDSDSE